MSRSFPRRCVIPRAEFSFLRSNVSVHPRRTLCAVVVERLVGIFILAVHALALSEIVAAWSMLFPLSVVEGPLVVRWLIFLIPTSGFRRRPTGHTIYDCSVRRRSHSDSLWAVAWNPLLDRKCFISCPVSAPKALEIVKMAEKSRFRARRAHFCGFRAIFSCFRRRGGS